MPELFICKYICQLQIHFLFTLWVMIYHFLFLILNFHCAARNVLILITYVLYVTYIRCPQHLSVKTAVSVHKYVHILWAAHRPAWALGIASAVGLLFD